MACLTAIIVGAASIYTTANVNKRVNKLSARVDAIDSTITSNSVAGDEDADTVAVMTTDEDDERTVYMCTSPNARCYHYDRDCPGLRNCRYGIVDTPEYMAAKYGIDNRGLRPCRICCYDK